MMSAKMESAIVAPLVGAWVEIGICDCNSAESSAVAPLVGAWVEIRQANTFNMPRRVAPLVGAWVEIM